MSQCELIYNSIVLLWRLEIVLLLICLLKCWEFILWNWKLIRDHLSTLHSSCTKKKSSAFFPNKIILNLIILTILHYQFYIFNRDTWFVSSNKNFSSYTSNNSGMNNLTNFYSTKRHEWKIYIIHILEHTYFIDYNYILTISTL